MKTATDILKSNGLISERETGIEVLYVHGHLSLVNALEQYAALKVAAERERIKNEIYKVFGDSVVEEWSSSRIRKEILEKLIDSL